MFYIDQLFTGSYLPEAAVWCNSNGAYIEKTADGYIIKAVPEPSREEYAASVRAERDFRLNYTDYLLMPDYPLKEEERKSVIIYRQQLRDLPQKAGFPWRGANDPAVPWPVKAQTITPPEAEPIVPESPAEETAPENGASGNLNTEAACA